MQQTNEVMDPTTAVFACVGWASTKNCLHADMKLPYPFSARHCFSLLLILLVMESRMATLIALDGLFSDVLRPNKK